MSIEQNKSERFEEMNNLLESRLVNFKETMTVKLEKWKKYRVTLLQIYKEWISYLKKKNEKEKNNSNHLLDKWGSFVITHGVDIAEKLVIEFFKKKRDYVFKWTLETVKEYWSWKDICSNMWLYHDKDLIKKLFPSYSAAEVRIRKQLERGEMLDNLSENIAETLFVPKSETDENVSKWNKNLDNSEQTKTWEIQKEENRTWVQLEIEFPEEKSNKFEEKNKESVQDKKTENPTNWYSNPDLDDWYEDKDDDQYEYPWQRWNNR